jgi:tetratricopeptide (TPR) repeat protein
MRMTARVAALHNALWVFDEWYRRLWYVWPASLALLICGWIVIEKPHETAPASSTAPSSSAKPVGSPPPKPAVVPPMTMASLPTLWPEPLRIDASLCFSVAIDLKPLIDACTRLIDSGQANANQLEAVYAQRGDWQRLQQPERALADYNEALKLRPNTAKVLTDRAFVYITLNQLDAAIEDLNQAIELLPPKSAGRALYYRGTIFLKRKDYDRALNDLNDAEKSGGSEAGHLSGPRRSQASLAEIRRGLERLRHLHFAQSA